MKKIIFILLFIIISIHASQTVSLTQKEKDFLKKHPTITLGTGDSWDPFVMNDTHGNIIGYDNDVLKIINKATGANFIQVMGDWVEMQKKAKAKEIDGLSTLAIFEERKKWLNFSDIYISLQKMVMVKYKNPKNIKSNKDLDGKTIVIHKGNLADETIAKKFKNSKIIYADTVKQMLNEVIYAEADATFGNGSTSYLLSKMLLPYLDIAYPLEHNLNLAFAVRKDWPEAISILNKGLATISHHDRVRLKQKWFFTTEHVRVNNLTETEKVYLKNKKQITMCVDPMWMPFEKIKDGKHIGISASYFKLFQKDIGIPIKLINTNSWTQSLEFAEKRKCDILSLVMRTTINSNYLNCSKDYLEAPMGLATKKNISFIDNFKSLKNVKIGIVKDYGIGEIIKYEYPDINIVEVKNITDGLQQVERGDIFGFIDTIPVISNELQANYSNNLKITGKFNTTLKLGVGVRNDDLVLLNIFNKVIGNLTPKKKQDILDKHISIQYQQGFDYLLFVKIFTVFTIVSLFLLYRYVTLKFYNKELKKLSLTDSLTQVPNRLYLDNNYEREEKRSLRYSSELSIMIVDIDLFKNINDIYGHKVGDNVLIEFANILSTSIRSSDILGRWGGEEFLIICPETNLKEAEILAQKIRKNIEKFDFTNVDSLTCSIGVTNYHKDDKKEDTFIRADKALYTAKNNGRNAVVAVSS